MPNDEVIITNPKKPPRQSQPVKPTNPKDKKQKIAAED